MNSKLIFTGVAMGGLILGVGIVTPPFAVAQQDLQQDLAEKPQIVQVQEQDVPPEVQAADDDSADKSQSENKSDENITDTAAIEAKSDIGNQFIRFHMWDGSIVGGDVAFELIDIDTTFGTLQIPIRDILKFHPGLDSIPALGARITTLVEGLGDKDFSVRENSHRELVSMGLQLQNEIGRFEDGGSAERKKHLEEIKKLVAEMSDESGDLETGELARPLIRGDLIVTREFSIVGKIRQSEFQLSSKFGDLLVNLADIRMADRSFNSSKEEVRKSVEISGTSFFQTSPVSTKIRVNRGDKISIRASGVVQWTNWSTSSGPDGIENQGTWQNQNSGTLMARVGKGDNYIKIGSSGDFVAKQTGELFLGIAIQDNFAKNNSGYRWDGDYTAKIVIQPAK